MATKDSKMAAKDSKMAAKDSKMATKDSKMAAKEFKMAAKESKMAAKESKMASKYLSPSEFENVCRVCLKQRKLQSIFAYKVTSRKPAEDLGFKFRQCSGLGCEPTDGLPRNICMGCYGALVAAYHFRSLCSRSALTLEWSLKEHAVDNKSHIVPLATPNNNYNNISEQSSDKTIKEEASDSENGVSDHSDVWAGEPNNDSDFEEVAIKKSRLRKSDSGKSLEESGFENAREISEMNMSLSELQKYNKEEISDGLVSEGDVGCPRCEARFATTFGLELHTVEAHSFEDEAGFSCYGCDAVFPSELGRALHEEGSCPNMRPGTKYCCRLCSKKVDSRAQFDAHLEGHRVIDFIAEPSPSVKQPFYRCADCPYTSRNAEQAGAHRLRHRGLRPFSCPRPACSFRTDLRASLAQHAARHAARKPHACPQCAYRARGMSSLRNHVKNHKSWDKCQICDAPFAGKQELLDHGASEHGAVQFSACPRCAKFFTGKSVYSRHVATCAFVAGDTGGENVADDKYFSADEMDVVTTAVKADASNEKETHLISEYGKMVRTSEMRYSCDSCEYVTKQKRYLASHLRSHEAEPSFKCHICPFRSRYVESLKAHGRTHSQRLPYQCVQCDETFLDEDALQKHVALVHDKLPLRDHTCKFCAKQFTLVANLKRHSTICSERLSSTAETVTEKEEVSEEFECETCGLACRSPSALSQHAARHAESAMLVCRACPFACSTRAALRRHGRVHAARRGKGKHARGDKEVKKQECSMCQQSFPSRVALRAHVRLAHAALMRYQCPWCEARYCSSGGYYPHVRMCHKRPASRSDHDKKGEIKKDTTPRPPRPKMAKGSICAYVCEICGQILGSKNSHAMHMNRHAGKRRMYSCGRCSFSSAYSEAIRAHRLRHDGLKPYACAACSYRTDMKSSLAIHARMHAGDLRHACRLCPFRAINVSNLKRHMAKHTQDKPYKCQQCDKSYFDKKSLSDHVACKHEGVKPYSCPLCAVLFSSLKGQRRHLGKFHPGAPKGGGRAGAPLEGQTQAHTGGQVETQLTRNQPVQVQVQLGAEFDGNQVDRSEMIEGNQLSGNHMGGETHLGGVQLGNESPTE